jgi:hypothetical protein
MNKIILRFNAAVNLRIYNTLEALLPLRDTDSS